MVRTLAVTPSEMGVTEVMDVRAEAGSPVRRQVQSSRREVGQLDQGGGSGVRGGRIQVMQRGSSLRTCRIWVKVWEKARVKVDGKEASPKGRGA